MLRTTLLLICTFSLSITFGQEWELLTPISDGDIIRNCSFFDSENGYAVIQADGVVLKTTDGGDTWSRPWTPGMSSNLYDIEMVSMDTIFTSGTSGEIFRSIDSGESFQEMTTGTTEVLFGLEFLNSSVGFAAGFNGLIIKTEDGGATWEEKVTGTTDRFFDIQFSSELIGYACGFNGVMVKTTDGGETWELLDTEYDGSLFRCSFPSDSVGYACGFSETILKTLDGGETWVDQGEGGSTALRFIEFRDEVNGWTAGDNGIYLFTNDGGQNWGVTPQTQGETIWCGQYLEDGTAYLMGRDCMFKNETELQTWFLLKKDVPNATYYGVHFFDDEHGYAAGAEGDFANGTNRSGIVYTENGGRTWETQNIGFSDGWRDIHFSDELNGTVVGGDRFGRTADGGNNWIFSTLDEDLTGAATWFFDDDTGFIGGDGLFSNICKTTDGGNNFTCGDNLAAGDFFFLNDTLGYAVFEGTSETVFKTIDAGENWIYLESGIIQTKHSLYFIDEETGWVGTGNGAIYSTVDGGENWTSSFFSGGAIVGIKFFTPDLGFCLNQQGELFQSIDGGASWNVILDGLENTMATIEEGYFTENYVYAGAQSGDIYRSELGCGSTVFDGIETDAVWCEEGENTLTIGETSTQVSVEWTLPEGYVITEDNGNTITAAPGAEGGIASIIITNACGVSNSAETSIELAPALLEIEGITAPETLCTDQVDQISILNPQDGVTFNWTYDDSWSVTENGEMLELTGLGVSSEYSVFSFNACGTTEVVTGFLDVLEVPDVSLDLGQSSICEDLELTLSGGLPTGGFYSGEGVSDEILTAADVSNDTTFIAYNFIAANGCLGQDSVELIIASTDVSVSSIEGSTIYCAGGTSLLQTPDVVGANQTSWSYPGEWTIAFTPTSLNILNAEIPGMVIFTAFNDCGTQDSDTVSISLSDLPEIPELVSFDNEWCANLNGLTSLSVSNDLFFDEGGLTLDSVATTEGYDFTISGDPGTYEVSFQTENICGVSEELLVNYEILELAASPELISAEDAWCSSESGLTSIASEGEIFLSVSDLTIDQSATDTGVDYTISGDPGTYELTFQGENECGVSEEVVVITYSIDVSPVAPELISSDDVWCSSASGLTSFSTPDQVLISSSDLTFEEILTVNGIDYTISGSPGTYDITFQGENACGVDAEELTLSYEILETPEVSLTFDSEILCIEEPVYTPAVSPAGGTLTGSGAVNTTIETAGLDIEVPYDYTYSFTAENGCEASSMQTVSFEICFNVNEIESDLLQLYPNPTSDFLTINKGSAAPLTGIIFNLTGQRVAEVNLSNSTTIISVSHLPSGLYILQLGNTAKRFEVR